jgi:hypothetical protein
MEGLPKYMKFQVGFIRQAVVADLAKLHLKGLLERRVKSLMGHVKFRKFILD